MAELLVATALLCAACISVGRAIFMVLGDREWSGLEPALGLALLFAVAGLAARLPGDGDTANLAVGALVLASAASFGRSYPGLRSALPSLAGVGLVALALALPFAVNGRLGLIGVGYNNDLGLHLAWSTWLQEGLTYAPPAGYPMGPHALVSTLEDATGIGLGRGFTALILAIMLITCATAVPLLRRLSLPRRVIASALTALSYLGVSFFSQSAFKELSLALFVLALAAMLDRWRGFPPVEERWRFWVPMVVVAAGILFSYSFIGLVWPALALAAWQLLALPAGRRRATVVAFLQRRWQPLAAGALVAAVLAVLVMTGDSSSFGQEVLDVQASDTYGPVAPVEALGVWLTPDYRLDASGDAFLWPVGALLAAIALALGLSRLREAKTLGVGAALAACACVYLATLLPGSGDYVRAKALAVLAPIVMLTSAIGVLSPAPAGGRRAALALRAVGALFIGAAALSSLAVLRDTSVGPPGHAAELRAFVPVIGDRKVLYAGQDRFAAYRLRGTDVRVPLADFPDRRVLQNTTKPFRIGDSYTPIDFDSFSGGTLDRAAFVITSRAAFASRPPSNFRRVMSTPSYDLWRRTGPTPPGRRTLVELSAPAGYLDCESDELREVAAAPGRALLFPDPAPHSAEWTGGNRLPPGGERTLALEVPAGSWNVSLQYFSPFDLTVRLEGSATNAEESELRLPAALDGQRPEVLSLHNTGQFWHVTTLGQSTPGTVRFSVSAEDPSFLKKITGYGGEAILETLALTRRESPGTVALRDACGKMIDRYSGPVAAPVDEIRQRR